MGAQEDQICPQDIPEVPYEIHYYSSFIPTHGTDTIIRAAKLLEGSGITFVLSGAGQCLSRDKALAQELDVTNVQFVPRCKDIDDLNRFINSSWICLGVFAKNARAERIVGSKVFEQLRAGKAVVTANTTATRELLVDGQSALLVELDNPRQLADKILLLKHDDALRQSIGQAGACAYEECASQKIISEQLKHLVGRLTEELSG